MRKKGDKVVNGKLVRAPETIVFTQADTVTASTGLALSGALKTVESMEDAEHVIVVKISATGAPVVTMTGFWNGSLLKAAMSGIQKQYHEVRRHATVWAMKKSQESKVA